MPNDSKYTTGPLHLVALTTPFTCSKLEATIISEALARHVADLPAECLPETTLHAARRALLDGVGVMLGASGRAPEVVPFVELAADVPGTCSVMGTAMRSSAALAAFANGAMAHALDFEDAYDPAPCHPNAALLPAALAVVQERGGVSGRALLAAIAIGCDLVCRLGLSLTRPMEEGGWYPPPILGVFGAVATAARLRGLDAERTRDAFSLALCQATMPGEIKYSQDTVIRAIREAFPAQAAVQASALAARGVRGFETPFEGQGGFFRLFVGGAYDPKILLDGLGERFAIDALTFKRWPACRGTHAYIEAAQDLRACHAIDTARIETVVAIGGQVQRMLAEPRGRKAAPATAIDAKFSIPFTVASALLQAEVTLDSFTTAALADTATRDLSARVRFEERADWGRAQAASGTLRLITNDGVTVEQTIVAARGDPSSPLDDDELRAKFLDCAGHAHRPYSVAAAARLADALWSIGKAPDARAALKDVLR